MTDADAVTEAGNVLVKTLGPLVHDLLTAWAHENRCNWIDEVNKKRKKPLPVPLAWDVPSLCQTIVDFWWVVRSVFRSQTEDEGLPELKMYFDVLKRLRNRYSHQPKTKFTELDRSRFIDICEHVLRAASANDAADHVNKLRIAAEPTISKDWSRGSGPRLEFGVPITKRSVLKEVYRFDENAYVDEDGETKDISFELFCDWWDAFPTGFLCAFEDDKPIAVVGLFPVTEAWANRFLQREVSEHELDRETIKSAIAQAKESPRTYWYLSGLSSNPELQGLSSHLPRILGYALFEWLHVNASSIGTRPIIIVSEGTTKIGERLLRDYFRFKLERPATLAEEKPRFSTETSLVRVRNFLTRHDLFSKCEDLQREIASMQ